MLAWSFQKDIDDRYARVFFLARGQCTLQTPNLSKDFKLLYILFVHNEATFEWWRYPLSSVLFLFDSRWNWDRLRCVASATHQMESPPFPFDLSHAIVFFMNYYAESDKEYNRSIAVIHFSPNHPIFICSPKLLLVSCISLTKIWLIQQNHDSQESVLAD